VLHPTYFICRFTKREEKSVAGVSDISATLDTKKSGHLLLGRRPD